MASLAQNKGSRWALIAFLLLILLVVFILTQLIRVPVLNELSPRLGAPGEILVLEGSYFGDERGIVYMAGERITQSFYLEWSDSKISIRIPQGIRSGLVHVENKLGRSNGLLYAHKTQVPVPGLAQVGGTDVLELSASRVRRGQTIELRSPIISDSMGKVTLYWQNPAVASTIPGPASASSNELFPAIRTWHDGSASIVVPSAALSGAIILRHPSGSTVAASVQVEEPTWATFHEDQEKRRSITLRYGIEAVLWPGMGQRLRGKSGVFRSAVPLLAASLWQQPGAIGVEVPEQAALEIGGAYSLASLAQLDKQLDWMHSIDATAELRAGRWEFEERLVNSSLAGFEEETAAALRLDTELFAPGGSSAEAQRMRLQARSLIGLQSNMLRKARLVWDWVLTRLDPSQALRRVGIEDLVPRAMQAETPGRANAWGYSLLLTGMLRAADIPARIEQGLLLMDYDELVPHVWVSFFIPEVGWVPVDPALADGLHEGQSFLLENPRTAYFAASDGRHIGFGPLAAVPYSAWESISPEGSQQWLDLAGPLSASPQVRIDKPAWLLPVLVE